MIKSESDSAVCDGGTCTCRGHYSKAGPGRVQRYPRWAERRLRQTLETEMRADASGREGEGGEVQWFGAVVHVGSHSS